MAGNISSLTTSPLGAISTLGGSTGSLGTLSQFMQQVPTNGSTVSGPPTNVLSSTSSTSPNTDTRVRLAPLNAGSWYTTSPIMQILTQTNGMLFPYTPNITFTQAVDYMNLQLVHSNTDYPAYTRTPSVTISINGKFTVQNQREGLYALAAIHFLRTVSKSYFGASDPQAGLPPPVLTFSGYGNYMFNNLRVILKSHSFNFDENMDTIPISIQAVTSNQQLQGLPEGLRNAAQAANASTAPPNGGSALQAGNSTVTGTTAGIVRLPALFTISCELTVVQTPARMRNVFNFDQFASGKLMNSSMPGWI